MHFNPREGQCWKCNEMQDSNQHNNLILIGYLQAILIYFLDWAAIFYKVVQQS